MSARDETEPITSEVNGVLIDLATGEIVGHPDPAFAIDSPDRLNWAMRKILEHEATKLGHEALKAAVVRDCDALIHQEDSWLAAFHRRFDGEIEDYARRQLQGQKTKTLRTPFGSVAFHIGRESIELVDAAAAVVWAEDEAPEIVKRSVNKTDVYDAINRLRVPGLPSWLRVLPAVERMRIETGVRKEES